MGGQIVQKLEGELSGLIVLGASCPDTKGKHKAHLDTVANLCFYF